MTLTQRKMKILAAIVHSYIETCEPVGSKLIAANMGVSSATVRNEMAELSEMGYLDQPHTSAGRVPSERGYRFYLDHLMEPYDLSFAERQILDSALHARSIDTDRMFQNLAGAIARVTHLSVAATTPSGIMATVRAVQFVQTSRRTAMIVLMASTGTIKTKVFHCDFDLTPDILRIFFRVFNEKLARKRVIEITPAFVQNFGASLGEMMFLMATALAALEEVAADTLQSEVCIDGQMNLLFCPEYKDGSLLPIMEYLERPQEFAQLIRGRRDKTQTLCGSEIGRRELVSSGLAISKYYVGKEEAGAIGILGPMRMDYAKCEAVLSYITESLGEVLTRLMEEE